MSKSRNGGPLRILSIAGSSRRESSAEHAKNAHKVPTIPPEVTGKLQKAIHTK